MGNGVDYPSEKIVKEKPIKQPKPLSPRLTDRLNLYYAESKQYRKDCEEFVKEDIFIYSTVIGCALGHDFFYNFLYRIHLVMAPTPIHFGFLQFFIVVSFAILLIRKIGEWNFYK